MACLISISDAHVPSLEDFMERHRNCSEPIQSMDWVPDVGLSYSYVPSSLGGVVTVECVCGARWCLGDGMPYETRPNELQRRDILAGQEPAAHSLRILHLAFTRPQMLLGGTGRDAVIAAEALWQGMCTALFPTESGDVFDRIVMEWTSVINERHETSPQHPRHGDAYLAAGVEWDDILRSWDADLCEYVWKEFPSLAVGAGLPKPSLHG